MNRLLSSLLIFCLVIGLTIGIGSANNSFAAAGKITLEVNGDPLKLDVDPVLQGGRVLVPVRAVFEALGGQVEWIPAGSQIKGRKGDINIELKINDKVAKVNGAEVALDTPPQIINKRTLIPVRFVSEKLGAKVVWDGNKNKVKIYSVTMVGANLELSGPLESFAKQSLRGMELAVQEINSSGGVLGNPLKLVSFDNKSDPDESATGVTNLINDKDVIAILGATTSGNTLGSLNGAKDYKVPIITPSGTNPVVTVDEDGQTREFAFRTSFVDPLQGALAVNFAMNSLKLKNGALLYDEDAPYSTALADTFKKTFKDKGGTLVFEDSYKTREQDFINISDQIIAKNPEFIYMPGYYQEAGLFIKQIRAKGYTGPIIGGDGYDASEIVIIAGKAALKNVYFTNHFITTENDPKVQKFVQDFKTKYGEEPDPMAALGYDTVYLLADAIKRAGSDDPEKVTKALASTKDMPAITGVMSIDSQHNPVKSGVVIAFKEDGTYSFVTRVNP